MEIIKQKHGALLQALASLHESLEVFTKHSNIVDDEIMHAIIRDSCIQRFEYTFDAFWKFIKLYLEECEIKEIVC